MQFPLREKALWNFPKIMIQVYQVLHVNVHQGLWGIQSLIYWCVGFVLVLSGKPMCIGCLSLGACLLVENYSMKTMESSCSHVRNITCKTSAMTHTREAFAFQGKV